MTALALQSPGHAGLQLSMTTPTTGAVDTVPTGAGIGMLILAGSGTGTVTIPIPNVDGTQAVTGRLVTIASGNTPWSVPLPSTVYGVGPVTLTWGGTLTGITYAVVTTP
jgi:hypothetical protein